MKEEIEVPIWWKNGRMLFRRDCLSGNHSEHTYNYIKRELNVDPELYGVEEPAVQQDTCPTCGATKTDDKV